MFFTRTKTEWTFLWNHTDHRRLMLMNVLLFSMVSFFHISFLQWAESRNGFLLNDWIHRFLPARDFSLPIFALTWFALLGSLLLVLLRPIWFFAGLLSFTFMFILRSLCMFLIPLEAPADLIPLVDPVAGFFLHNENVFVKKDLFFSGHTASLCILALIIRSHAFRYYLLFCLLVVPFLIVWQRVHYTVDILAAPVAAWFCVRMARKVTAALFSKQSYSLNRIWQTG